MSYVSLKTNNTTRLRSPMRSNASSGTNPRRYAPHALPRGLSQVCGHTPHRRSWRELVGFHEGDEGAPGVVRTLVVGDAPRYTNRRLPPAAPGEAHVYYIDADLAKTPPSEVRLFTA